MLAPNENIYHLILSSLIGKIQKRDITQSIMYVCLFDLWFYVPVNNYGHVEMVSEPNHTVTGQAS